VKTHELKTWPAYYDDIILRGKNFEIRYNDRGYQEGDLLLLREYNPDTEEYTGRTMMKKVVHICDNPKWCKEGYVVMALEEL